MPKPTIAEYQMPNHEYVSIIVDRKSSEIAIRDSNHSVPIPSESGLDWLIDTLTSIRDEGMAGDV